MSIFCLFHSTTNHFRDAKLLAIAKIGHAPNDPGLILYTTSHFRYSRFFFCFFLTIGKIENAPKDRKNDIEPLTVKSTLHTVSTCTYPLGPTLYLFHSTTSVFEIESSLKFEKKKQQKKCTGQLQTNLKHLAIKDTMTVYINICQWPKCIP